MGAKLVLLAFGLFYALVGVAMSSAHGWIAPVDDWIWSGLTLGAITLMLGLQYPALWLTGPLGISDQTAVFGILAVICVAFAAFAIWRLVRRDGRGKALATFLLMFALTVPASLLLALYKFSTFGH